jgi:hypothetical protein
MEKGGEGEGEGVREKEWMRANLSQLYLARSVRANDSSSVSPTNGGFPANGQCFTQSVLDSMCTCGQERDHML